MARRRDHSREELRQLILDTLTQHLEQAPYQSLSIRQLSQQVGYVPSSILNVFGSYQLCWLEVCAGVLDELYQLSAQAGLTTDKRTDNKAEQKILAVALAYHDYAWQKPYFWKLVFDLRLTGGQAMPEWQGQRLERLFSLIKPALAQLKPNAAETELADTSRTLWASVHGITQLTLEDPLFSQGSSADTLIKQLLSHFLASWRQS